MRCAFRMLPSVDEEMLLYFCMFVGSDCTALQWQLLTASCQLSCFQAHTACLVRVGSLPKACSWITCLVHVQAPTHDVNTDPAAAQPREGPFDFRSPVQKGRPEVPPQGGYGMPHDDEYTEEEKERGMKCGRALLARAMLGPPLQEDEKGCLGSSGAPDLQCNRCHPLNASCWKHLAGEASFGKEDRKDAGRSLAVCPRLIALGFPPSLRSNA